MRAPILLVVAVAGCGATASRDPVMGRLRPAPPLRDFEPRPSDELTRDADDIPF